AMLSAQEFTFVQVSGKNMLRLASRGGEETDLTASAAGEGKVHKVRPWQAREQGKKQSEEKRAIYAERSGHKPEREDERPARAFQKFQKDRKPFPRRERPGGKPFGERKAF